MVDTLSQEGPDAAINAQFFSQFSRQAGFRSLPLFDFAAGKLPFAGEVVSGRTSGNKDLSVSVQDGSGDCLHAYGTPPWLSLRGLMIYRHDSVIP